MSIESNPLNQRAIRFILLLLPVAFVLLVTAEVGHYAYTHHLLQRDFQKAYGADWQAQYEVKHGPLSEHNQKLAVGAGSIILVSGLVFGIYRMTRHKPENVSKKRRRKRKEPVASKRVMPRARQAHLVPR